MHEPLKAAVIHNGIEGLDGLYPDSAFMVYNRISVAYPVQLDISQYDVLIVPNGSDHVFMECIKDTVEAFLAAGGVLCCFDGWFTPWVPGNRWVMDNSRRTIDVRYKVVSDPYGFMKGIDIDGLNFSNGISGWWACGYIQPAAEAIVVLEDTWHRPLLIVDEHSTNGTMILSASAPLSDSTYATTDDDASMQAVAGIYRNIVEFMHAKKYAYEKS
ncbi:MAG TPA: hypothetical protein DHW15_05765 [Bacteroidetes bacterium]|jgi:hypothetical protein|nr:MAG: hypothetical protein ABR94_06820 [Sphingobacteriales bacterium BACL12 MAG-120802-bin5]KRP13907.1 MAG: hypothetical protein ABR95_12585 [Sphingobacteriales bacterium BACL12 MAG-120813-bin55]HCK21667.1 hypothetical protein [Bacteroidota bacterium]